ncbi:hypothetical protein KC349_g3189 [Hortaea werneckii]|nr:hypothetical protein KC349_g3189 [Hortaea werneckii]
MPIATGFLNLRMLGHLLQHYAERYHPLMPVVPQHVLSTKNLQQTVAEECFLLTAVLTIASKDRPELGALHNQIWAYMQQLILHVAIGASSTRHVGSVEGLLILAEWAPHGDDGMPAATIVAESGEDSAWSLVGLARGPTLFFWIDKSPYVWARRFGVEGSSARFTANDYPTLQPKHAYEDDFASVLQAQVEITSLFGQVHDILYSSKERTVNLMLKGDYTKYLDDHARALAAWKDNWKSLRVSQYLKAILDLHYEYLRLYVTAFAFQAVVCRTMQETPPRNTRYGIYAAVFLFKARSFGAVTKPRHQQSVNLVQAFILRLDAAASSETHTAARYSKLLSALYFPDALRTDEVISSNAQLPERQESQEAGVNHAQYPGTVDESNTPAYDEVFNSVMINSGLANSNVNDAFNIFGMDYSNFLPPAQSMDALPPHDMDLGSTNGLNFHSGPSGDPFLLMLFQETKPLRFWNSLKMTVFPSKLLWNSDEVQKGTYWALTEAGLRELTHAELPRYDPTGLFGYGNTPKSRNTGQAGKAIGSRRKSWLIYSRRQRPRGSFSAFMSTSPMGSQPTSGNVAERYKTDQC